METDKLKQPGARDRVTDYEDSSKRRPGKSGKRRKPSYQRSSFRSRLSSPVLQCRRCGERYRVSWMENTRCPKCGRHPLKIQPWESVLYTLFLPAALIGAFVHYGRSPRNAAIIFLMGLVGVAIEAVIFLLSRA
jgi:hypothetical protein